MKNCGESKEELMFINPDNLSDKYVMAVGRFVLVFANLEEEIGIIIDLLFGCEPEAIANITCSMDMKMRCQILWGIMEYRLRKIAEDRVMEENMEEISRLRKKIDSIIERRNIIIHSFRELGNSEVDGIYHIRNRGRQSSGKPLGKKFLINALDIEKDIKDIEQVGEELWEFSIGKVINWILVRAKEGKSGIYYYESSSQKS